MFILCLMFVLLYAIPVYPKEISELVATKIIQVLGLRSFMLCLTLIK